MGSDVLIFEEIVVILQAYTLLAMRKILIIPFPVILAKIIEHILFYNLKPCCTSVSSIMYIGCHWISECHGFQTY